MTPLHQHSAGRTRFSPWPSGVESLVVKLTRSKYAQRNSYRSAGDFLEFACRCRQSPDVRALCLIFPRFSRRIDVKNVLRSIKSLCHHLARLVAVSLSTDRRRRRLRRTSPQLNFVSTALAMPLCAENVTFQSFFSSFLLSMRGRLRASSFYSDAVEVCLLTHPLPPASSA
jgi:hypothetical protein